MLMTVVLGKNNYIIDKLQVFLINYYLRLFFRTVGVLLLMISYLKNEGY